MKRVLVTGASGQLGKCIQKNAASYRDLEFEFHSSQTLDITDTETTAVIFAQGNFQYCINCAAYTNVEQAEKTPETAFKINAEGVKLLSEQCSAQGVTLIHISTDYVFDGEKQSGYLPDDKTNPINVYGKSKLAGENHVKEILQKHFIVRTSWLYSEFGKNFYKTILQKAQAGEDVQITDEQTGCPTDANHLALYVLNLIANGATDYGIRHFTDGKAMTWYGFAQQILRENGVERKIKLGKAKNYRTFAKRPKQSVLITKNSIKKYV